MADDNNNENKGKKKKKGFWGKALPWIGAGLGTAGGTIGGYIVSRKTEDTVENATKSGASNYIRNLMGK